MGTTNSRNQAWGGGGHDGSTSPISHPSAIPDPPGIHDDGDVLTWDGDSWEAEPLPPGLGGGDLHYIHTQTPLSGTWTVIHNLGKYPSVSVLDTGNSVVLPNIHYDSPNQVTLTFSAPTSGLAVCN